MKKVKVSKGKEILTIDEPCLPHWKEAGWKEITEEKAKENSVK